MLGVDQGIDSSWHHSNCDSKTTQELRQDGNAATSNNEPIPEVLSSHGMISYSFWKQDGDERVRDSAEGEMRFFESCGLWSSRARGTSHNLLTLPADGTPRLALRTGAPNSRRRTSAAQRARQGVRCGRGKDVMLE